MNFVVEAHDTMSTPSPTPRLEGFTVEQRIQSIEEMVTLMSQLNCGYENSVLTECGRCGEKVLRNDPTGFCPSCSVCTYKGCKSPIVYDKRGQPQWIYRSCGRCMMPTCDRHMSEAVNKQGDELCLRCHFT